MRSRVSKPVAVLLILLAPLFSNCGGYRSAPMPQMEAVQSMEYATAPAEADSEAGSAEAKTAGVGALDQGISALAANQPDLYLIKTATLTIETDDARAAADTLIAALQPNGGYVSNLDETVDGLGRRRIIVTARVPARTFDQSMMQIESLGKVLNKQVRAEDVTEEYVDTDARARNLKQTEARLLEHLGRAGVLEEVLRVEQELTRVREQIEQLDGRLRFLDDRVNFSSIAITFQEMPKAEPVIPAETYSPAKVFTEAARSLVEFGQVALTNGIWFGVWAPVWLPPFFLAWFVYRRIRARRR